MKNFYLRYIILAISLSLITMETNAQWIQSNGIYGGDVRCITFLDTNLFIGTNGDGIFLSTNNGEDWNSSSDGLRITNINAFAVSGTNLFAGTNGGIFLSTNTGKNWAAISSGLTNNDVRCLAVSDTNLFAGTWGGGVFLSTNRGTSWNKASSGLTNTNVWSLAVSGTNLFAGTDDGVFLSTDNGTSWKRGGYYF